MLMFHLGRYILVQWKEQYECLNIDQKSFFFRCIENQYKNDEINDESFTKKPTRGINSLALSASRWEKNLVGNIKDEIIWTIF